MMNKTRWLSVLLALSGCYLETDKHPPRDRDISAAEAGVGQPPEASTGDMDASSLDASPEASEPDAEPPDAADAMPEVDAGCSAAPSMCPASTPLCMGGECVTCKAHADCTRFPATPACGPAGACVPCTADNKTLCTGATPACDAQKNSCVACNVDTECTAEATPACKADHTCGTCTEDADCTRFDKVCDTTAGKCVQCRPATEEADCRSDKACDPTKADCPGTACAPKTNTCTKTPRASVATCRACVSDSECTANHACIPMTFGEGATKKDLGGFCLQFAASGCRTPFGTTISGRTSLSSRAAQPYCGVNETRTSCAAVLAFAEECMPDNPTSCAPQGARCEVVSSVPNRCTYSCGTRLDCVDDLPCGGPAGKTYCGGVATP